MALFDFLSGSVGNNQDNKEEDVQKTKRHLGKAGYFDMNQDDSDNFDNPVLTRKLDTGIKGFQRDNDLKVDGVLKPRGETETVLFRPILF